MTGHRIAVGAAATASVTESVSRTVGASVTESVALARSVALTRSETMARWTRPAPVDRVRPPDRLDVAVRRTGRYIPLGRVVSAPVRRGWLDVRTVGRDNVPAEGPVVLAANHLAFIDSPLVMFGLDRPVVFLGKSEYLNNPVSRRLFPAVGMLPLDRSGRNSRITLDRVAAILDRGGAVGLHPEGTRSRDGRLHAGHTGVAQIALRAGAPIVPVALVGTAGAQPVGRLVPRFRSRIEIRYGAPIGIGPWADNRRSARSRRELTDEVMTAIAALSGQERADTDSDAASPHAEAEAAGVTCG
ncbi:MAG: lysophospholipid acyltransferase family protein [Actinomycetota bacterium]